MHEKAMVLVKYVRSMIGLA